MAKPKNYGKKWLSADRVMKIIHKRPVSSTRGINPKDIIGSRKPPLALVPSGLLIPLSKVFELGAKKYGVANWRQIRVRRTVYINAALRHLLSALDGEDLDPESGQAHEAHAAACCAIILDAQAVGTLVDDRPTHGAAARLIREMTEKES